MKKVLLVSMGETFGGIEKYEMDLMKAGNKKGYVFDILTPNNKSFLNITSDKHIKGLNITRKNMIGRIIYDIRLYKYLKNNKYDIVHINSSAYIYSFRVSLIAKIAGVKKIVTHSHNIYTKNMFKSIIYNITYPLYKHNVDLFLSCSESATKSLYKNNDNVIVISNGINIKDFKYNAAIQKKYIELYGFQDRIIYGHIGRFVKEKNHERLIDIFYEISKKQDNAILLLIGDGKLKEYIVTKVNNMGLRDKVYFLGFKNNINELVNIIDVLIFPSITEAFGISILEAYTSGVVCYYSNSIKLKNIDYQMDLSKSNKSIADMIIKNGINHNRKENYKLVKEYDISYITSKLLELYK